VCQKVPSHFFVGYSSGGLFKTENNGITFTPLFDDEMVMTIGDIAVDWDRDIIWIGTGEVNSSRSSYSGTGIFKSFDGGKTWEHAGLEESHHIGRIILHPSNPDIAWVAVLGHLYSPSEERGVFKTTDGGKTWNKTLYVNENAGAVDMVINPLNPDELYAATWERTRRSWNFVESGEGSGIYKSSDAGVTWELLTTKEAGFPVGEGAGRIGLALHEDQGKVTLYASIDNYFRRPPEADKDEDILTKDDLRDMSKTDFLALDKKKIQAYLSSNRFPRKYSVDNVISMVKKDEIQPVALVEYIEDANSLLFGTSVVGLEVYRSDDMGKSWSKTHDGYLNSVYNSYGYYFGQIRVAPYDVNKIYIMGVPIIRSDDGGKTFQSINGDNVHSDHHALWINPNRPGHLINGNDGGINISYDDGENWSKCNTPAVGQFYYIAVDMAEPYNVYGGLQDNGVWMGPNTYRTGSTSWHGSGRYPYQRIMGGDGMQVAIDTRDNATVYTGFQFGNYFRINTKTGENMRINIRHQLGERPLRWNWQTPVHLSIHNQDILYMGANKVFRSMNQAETFEPISEDLTTGGKKGDVAFSTLSTIHESPLKFGLLYVGSDDGLVHVSKNGGSSWEKITAGLPEDMWVSRIQASMHDKGTVYVVLNGYRWDDFTPYLYKSTDYGKSWIQMGKDLPMEPLNVVKEDPKNPNILYVGSDHGLYVSLDGGASFMLMNNKMPAAPVHDVVIHPTTGDILVGTHGRSIYKGRGVELQQLDEEILAMDVHAFKMDNMRASGFWGMSNAAWRKPSSPSTHIPVYAKNAGKATVSIKHGDLILNSMDVDCNKGLNYLEYDLTFDPSNKSKYEKALNEKRRKGSPEIKLKEATNKKMYLKRGDYTVVVAMNGELSETTLSLK
ncbi:MAG: glycosyl hydrolase, partial [Bacteroidota bacterium]